MNVAVIEGGREGGTVPAREMSELMSELCKQTIEGSHSIWCSRNSSVKSINFCNSY